MKPVECLFEREDLPQGPLPAALRAAYGGGFGLARPVFYANFVASVDGVVALQAAGDSGHLVSGDDEPDRFIMGLLRAAADAVVIGAGTFHTAGGNLWHPGSVYPQAAEGYTELRRRLGLGRQPRLVVVTGSGAIDTTQPALRDSLVLTTPRGAARLRGTLPAGARAEVLGESGISGRALVDFLHAQGLQTLLAEGGPTLVGPWLAEGVLDELFLTSSPRLFGRTPGDARKSLVHGVDLGGLPLRLSSVRRHESHLYLRFAAGAQAAPRMPGGPP